MMKTFNANKIQILTKLVLPANFANMISLLKINIGLSWVGVIVGEFLVSRGGIGYLVMYGGQVFKLDLVMMGVFILAIIAFITYEILNLLEKYLKRNKKRKQGLTALLPSWYNKMLLYPKIKRAWFPML